MGNFFGRHVLHLTDRGDCLELAFGEDPVLAGVDPFSSQGALPKSRNLAEDTTVLLFGQVDDCREPVAWTRGYRGGRVFYTSLGNPGEFHQPGFLRLLANALYWTAARDLGY